MKEFPGARVYSYGYPADVFGSRDTSGFEEKARALLEKLLGERRGLEVSCSPLPRGS